jgi:hypothetical protein
MNVEFKQFVIDEISKMPFYHVSPNGINHTIKCPYCNDDSPRHGHFALKIDVDSTEPILYNCLKCSHGGILTPDVLSDLNIYIPQNLAVQMRKVNKVYARKNNLTDITVMPFNIPEVYNVTPISVLQSKIDYVNKRLGTKLQISDASTYRLVLSVRDFMQANKIDHIDDIDERFINSIDLYYVGFLSVNKNYIVFRHIDNAPQAGNHKRYLKVAIDRKNIDPNNFYTIPTTFDIMNTDETNVHISEGPFDILSIVANHIAFTKGPNMFFAVCGFGYAGVIKNIIKMGVCPCLNLYIYADNDKSDREIIRNILNKDNGIVHYLKSLTIVRNSFKGEKDFGVPKDRIRPSYKTIPLNRR